MPNSAKNELVGAIFTPSTSAKNELYSIYSHVYPLKVPVINTQRTTGAPFEVPIKNTGGNYE